MGGETIYGDRVQSELDQEQLERIYYFLKQFILGMLKEVDPNDLDRYIKNNKAPNLYRFVKMLPAKVRRKVFEIGEKNEDLINKYLNVEQMLSYAEEELPQLYKRLSTPSGQRWLKGFVAYIKKLILESD
jgi:hydroxymethylpyrimidine pyrophosphatase-like HAD family hydrolase